MDISKAAKMMVCVCVVLSIVTAVLIYSMIQSLNQEKLFSQRQYEFLQIGHDLERGSDLLTREARNYSVSGDRPHYDAYWKEVLETKSRDAAIARLHKLGALPKELILLEAAKENSDMLILTEEKSLNAAAKGDLETARAYMFGQSYAVNKRKIMGPIEEFQVTTNARASREQQEVAQQARTLVWLVTGSVSFYLLLVLYLLYFVVFRKISLPLQMITASLRKISSGIDSTEIPCTEYRNEIGRLARSFKKSLILNRKLNADLKSHQESLERTVEERTKDLIAANNELEEFAYRTSHDLRSPIISSSRLLVMVENSIEGGDLNQALAGLKYGQDSLNKLETLIGDMLILAEAKGKEEEDQSVDIASLTENALEKMKHMDSFDRLEIRTDFQFQGEVVTKKSRINMVLENLISNAIKYQDLDKCHSYITISTRDTNGWLDIEVKDNGLGVPKDQQEKLFKMFQRFHPKVAFGSGLGLYLMKKCAEVVNGDIYYLDNNSDGGGSIFKLSIPVNTKEVEQCTYRV